VFSDSLQIRTVFIFKYSYYIQFTAQVMKYCKTGSFKIVNGLSNKRRKVLHIKLVLGIVSSFISPVSCLVTIMNSIHQYFDFVIFYVQLLLSQLFNFYNDLCIMTCVDAVLATIPSLLIRK